MLMMGFEPTLRSQRSVCTITPHQLFKTNVVLRRGSLVIRNKIYFFKIKNSLQFKAELNMFSIQAPDIIHFYYNKNISPLPYSDKNVRSI